MPPRHDYHLLRKLFSSCSNFWSSTLRCGIRRNITTRPRPHCASSKNLGHSPRKPRDLRGQVEARPATIATDMLHIDSFELHFAAAAVFPDRGIKRQTEFGCMRIPGWPGMQSEPFPSRLQWGTGTGIRSSVRTPSILSWNSES